MELSKCIRCKGFYQRVKSLVCPKCEIEEEKEIFQVQQYLGDHPGSTLEQVSDALNIYLEDIDRWIEENRLHVEVKQISDKKEAVRKLYDTVKGGIEEQSSIARERMKALQTGDDEWGPAAGKYRRI